MTMHEEALRLLELGRKELDSGDYDGALKHLSMSLSYLRSAEAYLLKAKANVKKNELKDALQNAEDGLTACGEEDESVRGELEKILEVINSKQTSKFTAERKFRDAVLKKKEGALKHTAARTFAEKHKQHSLRVQPVFQSESNSRLNADPQLPGNFNWPTRKDGTKLTFLAQIDLAEIANFKDLQDSLPSDGLLTFFYDIDEQPWGSSLAEKDGWHVEYLAKNAKVEVYPDENNSSLKPATIEWLEEPTFPDFQADEMSSLAKPGETEYEEFLHNCYEDTPIHRLLGHPQLVQSDFRESIEMVVKEIDYEKIRGDEKETSKLFDQSRRWKLLLQLDSDEELGYLWGDGGRLYFCIDENDLKRKDFKNVWVELQCY